MLPAQQDCDRRAIPGTTRLYRLHEKTAAADLWLTDDENTELALPELSTASDRIPHSDTYPEACKAWINR